MGWPQLQLVTRQINKALPVRNTSYKIATGAAFTKMQISGWLADCSCAAGNFARCDMTLPTCKAHIQKDRLTPSTPYFIDKSPTAIVPSTRLPENKAVCQMSRCDIGHGQISNNCTAMGSLHMIRHEEADLAAAHSLAGLSLLLC